MRVRKLILLRHGETEHNAENRMQGQLDTSLTDRGRDQAVEAAEILAVHQPLLIVTSDLQRAFDTATALRDRVHAPLHVDARLREMHLGAWQGLTEAEIDGAWPGLRLRWQTDPTWAEHGGESRVSAAARAMPLVHQLIAEQTGWGVSEPERPVVLASHNAVVSALVAALLGLPVDRWTAIGGLGNGSFAVLSERPEKSTVARWRLDVWNASARVAGQTV